MKRACLLAVIITGLVLPAMVFGVDIVAGPKVMVGHFGGFGDDYEDYLDYRDADKRIGLGGSFGGFVEVGILPRLALQPEVLFTIGGPGYKFDSGPPYDEEIKAKLIGYTVDIPILVKGKFDVGSVVVVVLGGPTLQVRVGTWKEKWKSSDSDLQDAIEAGGYDDQEYEDEAFEHDFGVGIVGGAGVELSLGPGTLMLDARYFHGLTEWFEGSDVKFRALLFSVGYGFPLFSK